MSWEDSLTKLLVLLARHYPDPAAAREVAERAGLPTGSIRFGGEIDHVWTAILREARRSAAGLRDLARAAAEDHPEVDFLALVRPIEEGADSPGPLSGTKLLAHLHRGVVHPLPAAPLFVGRGEDLDALHAFWRGGEGGQILALIGLGGAGKTAIASEFVSSLLGPAGEADRPDGLFVWSFYVDQEVNNFLRLAHRYFGRGSKAEAAGTGLLYRLAEALAGGGRNLIVLDGLERVQRPPGDATDGFGELEDPLLRQAITRLASGAGRTKCLITTRFPVPDLRRWEGRGYSPRALDRLDRPAARQLLRRHGVRGGDPSLDAVIDEYGSHALALDHVGAYLAEFRGGDPAAAGRLEDPRPDSDVPEERKLARVLRAYEAALSPAELDLLVRSCLFRTGTTVETLHAVFSRSDAPALCGALAGLPEEEFRRLAARLARLHLLLPEPDGGYTAHPAVRDHFARTFADAAEAHRVVGERLKSDSFLDLAEEWERASSGIGEVIHLLRSFNAEFKKYLNSDGTVDVPRYEAAAARRPRIRPAEPEWHPQRFYERLLAARGATAGRLREFLARQEHRLWPAYAERVGKCIRSLEDPSGQIFDLPEPEVNDPSWPSLRFRPGLRNPEHPAQLDVLEELIYHTIRAGDEPDAYRLYRDRMGGREHLGKRIGEYARGARILRYFPTCPNDLDLAWYLRGVGDLRASFDLLRKARPIWSGTVLCLRGFLPRVWDPLESTCRHASLSIL